MQDFHSRLLNDARRIVALLRVMAWSRTVRRTTMPVDGCVSGMRTLNDGRSVPKPLAHYAPGDVR